DHLLRLHLISTDDFNLFRVAPSVDAAIEEIVGFYKNFRSYRWVGKRLIIRIEHRITEAALAQINQDFTDIVDGHPLVQGTALADGKFHIVGFSKGLPGVAPDFEKKVDVDAATAGAEVVFDGSGWKGSIASGTLTGTNADGKTFVLKKTERASPTLGAKPPAG